MQATKLQLFRSAIVVGVRAGVLQPRRKIFVAALLLAATTSSARAAQVAVSIALNPAVPGCTGCTLSGAGTYDIVAQDVTQQSGPPEFGITSYEIEIQNVTSVLNRSPRATLVDDGFGTIGPAGFSQFRTANNQDAIPGGFQFGGSQDLATPTPYLIRGFGQSAGSFTSLLPPGSTISGVIQASWGAKLLLAEGTYNSIGPVPSIDVFNPNNAIFGFASPSGTNLIKVWPITPEPESIALAGLALVGLIGFARRCR